MPWARAVLREAHLPLLPGNLEKICMRARVSWRQKLVGSSGEKKVRVFDVPRLLYEPHGARKSI